MVSPFAMHQQQLAMLAQQQSLLMAAAKSGDAKFCNTQTSVPNGTNVPPQSWPNVAYPIPGLMMQIGAQAGPQTTVQVVGSVPIMFIRRQVN